MRTKKAIRANQIAASSEFEMIGRRNRYLILIKYEEDLATPPVRLSELNQENFTDSFSELAK